ncbi:MAG: hypothetical protein ABH800_02205 [Candidatus Nealsonbacteria bacterium]
MQIFELHFNPKKKEDIIFDSFVYEPENISEKKMGSLYIVGELRKALPSNSRLLNNLSSAVKKEYYESSLKKTLEAGLKESIKKANEFLDQEVRKENVSWLGNLNFSILTLKDFALNLTKAGDIKIILLRENEIIDIGKELETQNFQPYSLKLFGNIATGSIIKNDKILILTKEIFSFFLKSGALKELSKISEEKELRDFLKIKQKNFSEASGICLFLVAKEESKQKQSIIFRPEFSPKEIILKPILKAKEMIPSFSLPTVKTPKISFPSFKFKKPNIQTLKKQITIVVLFAVVLGLGFFIFDAERKKELKEGQEILENAQLKINQAESLIILKKEKEALLLFKETLNIVLPLTKIKSPLKEEALNLKKSIEEYLLQLD